MNRFFTMQWKHANVYPYVPSEIYTLLDGLMRQIDGVEIHLYVRVLVRSLCILKRHFLLHTHTPEFSDRKLFVYAGFSPGNDCFLNRMSSRQVFWRMAPLINGRLLAYLSRSESDSLSLFAGNNCLRELTNGDTVSVWVLTYVHCLHGNERIAVITSSTPSTNL